MPKDAVFTMKLEPELRAEFMSAAEAAHQPASQVLRQLMRDFIRQQQEVRDYEAFLRGKVEAARQSVAAGQGQANEAVEALFAARRAGLTSGT